MRSAKTWRVTLLAALLIGLPVLGLAGARNATGARLAQLDTSASTQTTVDQPTREAALADLWAVGGETEGPRRAEEATPDVATPDDRSFWAEGRTVDPETDGRPASGSALDPTAALAAAIHGADVGADLQFETVTGNQVDASGYPADESVPVGSVERPAGATDTGEADTGEAGTAEPATTGAEATDTTEAGATEADTALNPAPRAPSAPAAVTTSASLHQTEYGPDGLPILLPLPSNPYEKTPNIVVGRIQIPRIGLDHSLHQGMTLTAINRGPSQWPGSALPGQVGNMVIGGHRTTYSRPFRHLDDLTSGDEVIYTTDRGTFTYLVTAVEIVSPDAIHIADQTSEKSATLFACHPPGSARQRIVVKMRMVET